MYGHLKWNSRDAAIISQNEMFNLLLVVQFCFIFLLIEIHQGRKLRGNNLLCSISAWKVVYHPFMDQEYFPFFGHSLH